MNRKRSGRHEGELSREVSEQLEKSNAHKNKEVKQ